jgi:hypothetical protein
LPRGNRESEPTGNAVSLLLETKHCFHKAKKVAKATMNMGNLSAKIESTKHERIQQTIARSIMTLNFTVLFIFLLIFVMIQMTTIDRSMVSFRPYLLFLSSGAPVDLLMPSQ